MGLPRVIAQTSVQHAQSSTQLPVKIGRQLGVSDIIETAMSLKRGRCAH